MADNELIITSSEALENVHKVALDAITAIQTAQSRWRHYRLSKPTGDDQFSQALLKVYSAETNVNETLSSMVDGLQTIADDFHNMAVSYETTEYHNKQ